jgi:caffeoyl-CoA O-methyltransferase
MPIYNQSMSDFIIRTFAVEDEALGRIRKQTVERGLPSINIRPEEGRFLQFLVASNKSKVALEIGTLGGYSGTWIARGLPEDGKLITLEKEPHHVTVAQEHFQLAGVAGKVEILQGDAKASLKELENKYTFDFVFIDAEKEGYPDYLDWSLENVSSGGVIAAHNAFRGGAILDEQDHRPGVDAMRKFNAQLAADDRLIATVYPAGDGIAIAVKK